MVGLTMASCRDSKKSFPLNETEGHATPEVQIPSPSGLRFSMGRMLENFVGHYLELFTGRLEYPGTKKVITFVAFLELIHRQR